MENKIVIKTLLWLFKNINFITVTLMKQKLQTVINTLYKYNIKTKYLQRKLIQL